ncbi:LOW QUALITY PROTEIN: hypothetical protein MKX08_006471 [Trichoderma sp. CBMAI-0020]|nr:LOW QUALITY PROTEIN: hypothetical protein MKX08_006471 [Trichoderma sp. CBMAI-0020]
MSWSCGKTLAFVSCATTGNHKYAACLVRGASSSMQPLALQLPARARDVFGPGALLSFWGPRIASGRPRHSPPLGVTWSYRESSCLSSSLSQVCIFTRGVSGSSLTHARAAALPWHWQTRINTRPAHRKGRISARKLDGWTATRNRPGGAEEQIAGLLVALAPKVHLAGCQSHLGWDLLDITDGRGHWTPRLPEHS